MCIKDLFTVPEGKKITEKMLRRVLASSICGILLCMTCLISSTWAWYTVSIENTENVIHIATVTAGVTIKQGETVIAPSDTGKYRLSQGEYTISVKPVNEDPGPIQNTPVYILMYSNKVENYCFTFASSHADAAEKTLKIGIDGAELGFTVTWVAPVGAASANDADVLTVGPLPATVSRPHPTETTAPSTEATTEPVETEPAVNPSTEPEETEPVTEPSTEAATEPSTEPEETQATTEPSTESQETTESTTESTETGETEGEN